MVPKEDKFKKGMIVFVPFCTAPYGKLIRYKKEWWERISYHDLILKKSTIHEVRGNKVLLMPNKDSLVGVFFDDLEFNQMQYIQEVVQLK
jgi:hypothetical protein